MQAFFFFYRKLKLWFPLEGQKVDSLLWDSAFVLYSTEDAMTTSKVHSVQHGCIDVLATLCWMCDECVFAKMERKKKKNYGF